MKTLLCALIVSAVTMFGADLTGKWSGTFEMTRDGESRSAGAYMVLKQDGGKLTGTVGPSLEQQIPIKVGTIEESKIHLEAAPEQGPAVVKFELKLDGDDHLTGDISAEGEGGFKGKIDLKREKAS